MEVTVRSVVQSIYLSLFMAIIFGGVPPKRGLVAHISKTRNRKVPKRIDKIYNAHWTKSRDLPIIGHYQTTHSDAMHLYSIGAGHFVLVEENGKSWDHEYELRAVSRKKGGKHPKNGKQNKFVTETILYHRLKIRSEENNMYICAKSNGNIIFKDSADKKNGPRKRCMFKWSLTKEKHIQLSIYSGKRKWYLTVKDGHVKLLAQSESTTKERSFIWLPAPSSKTRPMNSNRRHIVSTHARGFSLMKSKDSKSVLSCPYTKAQVHKQKSKIKYLTNEKERLEKELARLNNLILQNSNNTTSSPPVER